MFIYSPWEVSLFMVIVLGALFLLLRSIKPQGMGQNDMFVSSSISITLACVYVHAHI